MDYTNKLVEFLNGANSVKVNDQMDFYIINDLMKKVRLKIPFKNYEEMKKIAKLNNCLINGRTILLEYQPYKGFSIGYKSFEESENWYGQAPWYYADIRDR